MEAARQALKNRRSGKRGRPPEYVPKRELSSAAIGARIIWCRNGGQRSARCRYLGVKKKGKKGTRCSNKTLSGDFCTRHKPSENDGTVPAQRAPSRPLSPAGSQREREGQPCPPCGAQTKMRLPCRNKAVQAQAYCNRHLNYNHKPPGVENRPPKKLHQEREYGIHQQREYKKTTGGADEEYLAPICRHCKSVLLRECNLCVGCRMRALSVVQEATGMDHRQIDSPPKGNRVGSSRSSPSPKGRARNAKKKNHTTINDILPKLKVCRPSDYGMPHVIPVESKFKVWNRWWIVKQSRLGPNTGFGLFAVHSIPEGEELFPYVGPQYDTATFKEISKIHPEIYIYALRYVNEYEEPRRQMYIDGRTSQSNVAGYINSVHKDKRGRVKNVFWYLREGVNSQRSRNYPFLRLPHVMTISATSIAADEELYTDYDWKEAQAYVEKLRAETIDSEGKASERGLWGPSSHR